MLSPPSLESERAKDRDYAKTNRCRCAAGPQQIVTVTFTTIANTDPNTPITFGDSPAIRRTSDVFGNPLPTAYIDGFIVFAQGFEGDVASRFTGDGALLANDITIERQFIVQNLLVSPAFNELQRADVSPTATRGDGQLDSTDLVVLRGYVTNQTLIPAAGPFCCQQQPNGPITVENGAKDGNADSPSAVHDISVASTTASAGTNVFVSVALESGGDENAMTFTLNFDQTRLRNPQILLGTDSSTAGGTLTTNTSQIANGRIGVLIDLPQNVTFPASPPLRKILTVRFTVAPGTPVGTQIPLSIDNSVVPRSTSDVNGNLITTNYIAGTVTVIGPTAAMVSVAGRVTTPSGAGLRNATVKITDGVGNSRTVTTSSFGYYQFDDVAAGSTYVLSVNSRTYRFNARTVTVTDSITDADFIGLE